MTAAANGVATLEDDPQFHAGIGSSLRVDGKTAQMDAVVADGTGMFGAVATIERVQNPVRVALALIATRRTMLAGPGAVAFARSNGFPDFDPTTAEAKARLREAQRLLATTRDAGAETFAMSQDGGLEASVEDASADASAILGAESWRGPIAVVVRSAAGGFAVAASGSGASGSMLGQVGALPLRGAAVYAGPRGAVAASGPDDDLVREMLARRVYDRLTRTQSPRDAATWALTQLEEQVMVGVIVVDKRSMYVASRGPMAWATWTPTQEQMPEGAKAPEP
jgi:isoaspartyl peptidase/L-asparaginase-like protein (Ntn-hydrolase superfamily)